MLRMTGIIVMELIEDSIQKFAMALNLLVCIRMNAHIHT